MKKLEKLTLKELNNSVMVLNREETNNLKGGDDLFGREAYKEKYGEYPPLGTGYDPFTKSCYDTNNMSVSNQPDPNNNQGSIGGPTPAQQYSQACAEGYTDAAKAIAIAAYALAATALTYFYKIPDTGSFTPSYDNFGGN